MAVVIIATRFMAFSAAWRHNLYIKSIRDGLSKRREGPGALLSIQQIAFDGDGSNNIAEIKAILSRAIRTITPA